MAPPLTSAVKEFRVQRLVELSKQVVVLKEASESPLMALLTLYKLYCPHLVPMGTSPSRRVSTSMQIVRNDGTNFQLSFFLPLSSPFLPLSFSP